MSSITMKDVANEVGVTVATVSNVINGNTKKTSAETIHKVNKAIKKLGYVPNYSARSLKVKQSKLIGLLIPQTEDENQYLLENPFYSELISGIESKLREKGYYMILTGIDEIKNDIDIFGNWNLDGAIVLGAYSGDFINKLQKFNIPIIFVDSYIDNVNYLRVAIDDEYGGYLATKYLIEKGHKKIGFASGKIRESGVEDKKFKGYLKAMNEYNLQVIEENLYHGYVDFEYGFNLAKNIKLELNVTAFFATSDILAIGLMKGFKTRGLKIPEQISIVGFDNIPLSNMVYPGLTTINQDILTKGYRCVDLLLNNINNKKSESREYLMPLTLIERDSVYNLREGVNYGRNDQI